MTPRAERDIAPPRTLGLALLALCLAAPAARAEDGAGLGLRGAVPDERPLAPQAASSDRLAVRSFRAPGGRDDIGGVILSAIDSSPKLKAAEHDAKAADWGVWKEGAGFLPTVSLGAQATRGDLSTSSLMGLQPLQTNRTGSLTLNLPVLSGGQTYYAMKSAASLASAAALERRAVSSDVAVEATTAYLQYLLAEKTARIVSSTSARMKRLVTAMRMRRDAGFASDADVAQIVAEDASLTAQLADARTSASKARVQAESLAGRRVVFVDRLPALDRFLPTASEAAGARAEADNPRVIAAARSADAALYSSRATFGRLLPQVAVVGQVRRDFDALPLTKRDAWQLGAQLSVPLLDAGSFLEYRQKRETATASQLKADDAARQARVQTETLWRQHHGDAARLRAADERARALRRVADTFETMFEAGLAQLDSVLEKYRMLAQAEIDLEQTRMQRYSAACQVLALMGKFEVSMLGATR